MFNGMGIQWASTLLGCVGVALIPIPVLFYLKGASIRKRSTFAPTGPSNTPGIQAPADTEDKRSSQAPTDGADGEKEQEDHAAAASAPRKMTSKEQA